MTYFRFLNFFKGLDNVQYSDFFIMADTELRGHELKVYKPQVHLDTRKYFFSVRIVDVQHGIAGCSFTLQHC